MDSRVVKDVKEGSPAIPRKEEWSIIYQHKAMEMERAKSLEKMIGQQKKQVLKKELDQQINSRKNLGQYQKEEDKRYSEYVSLKAKEMKEKEQRQKFQKYLRRRQIEQENQQTLASLGDNRLSDYGKIYNIQIGLRSQMQQKSRSEMSKQQMIHVLDQQTQKKSELKRLQRQRELQQYQRNQAYLQNSFNNRNHQYKKYEQNQAVYQYYQMLNEEKIKRNRQLEHRLVDQALQRKDEQQARRRENQGAIKERKHMEMRDTLQQQVQLHNNRRLQQHRSNPQQVSYSFIGDIFKEKRQNFDKLQYSKFLGKQVQEQRMGKIQRNYMSDEEYKLNSNQLNKALTGTYTHDKYYDRSMGALGQKVNVTLIDNIRTDDTEVIKERLDTLRNPRNKSALHSTIGSSRSQ